jgi:F-type H+-transporting ATPase subunit b
MKPLARARVVAHVLMRAVSRLVSTPSSSGSTVSTSARVPTRNARVRAPQQLYRLVLLLVIGCAVMAAQEREGGSSEPSMTLKVVNFAILAAGLGYLMAKNLPSFFQTRTGSIQKGIAEAQQMKQDAERRAAEMDKRLSALGADIETFRKQAGSEMEKEGERIRQETAAAIERQEQQAQAEIESAGKTARRELKTYAANLALDLAEQRIRARMDSATEAALVENFLSDLRTRESKN